MKASFIGSILVLIQIFNLSVAQAAADVNLCKDRLSSELSSNENIASHLASDNFELFAIAPFTYLEDPKWLQFTDSVARSNESDTLKLFSELQPDQQVFAARILLAATEQGKKVPTPLNALVENARASRNHLRRQTINFSGELTPVQQKELTYILVLVGVRRNKLERVFEKVKEFLGFKSQDLVPVVNSKSSENVLGDEVRIAAAAYNEKVRSQPKLKAEAYKNLIETLFELYLKRQYRRLDEPWFKVNNEKLNLLQFVNSGAYRQLNPSAENTWMNVVTLSEEQVQNPQLRGYSRELWWNRSKGIDPLGTVRLSRNVLNLPDGTQRVISVEVLRKGEDGFFVPYLFEADIQGELKAARDMEAMKKMKPCFGCHLRLSGIFFGGISMKNYKAVDDWHINAIDFTKRKYYKKFEAFK